MNTHTPRSEAEERGAWFGDFLGPQVISGGVPVAPGAGLLLPATACRAYVRGSAGDLVYVRQAAVPVGPLDAGNGTYWLAVHRDTSSTVPDWTREPQTHYVWRKSVSPPAVAADRLQVAEVTVAGGAITEVRGLGPALVWTWQFAPLTGSALLQAAIDALPPEGGTVMIEPGTYLLSETVTLGNGGVGQLSTRHGIILCGLSRPGPANTDTGVWFRWAGAAAGTMVAVHGPLVGWGVQNIHFDGGGVASVGLYVQSGQMGDSRNLIFEGHRYAGIHSTAVPTFSGSGVTDSLQNQWTNIRVWHIGPPAEAGSAGVVLDTTHVTSDTDLNTFTGTFVIVAGVAGYGIYLGGADTNTFFNTHITNDGLCLASILLAHDNPGSPVWPSGNNFYGLVMGTAGIGVQGTPAPPPSERHDNMFFGYANQGLLAGGSLLDLPGVSAIAQEPYNHNLMLMAPQGANVSVSTPVAHPRHFVPSVTNVGNLGTDSTRWKDAYLAGALYRPIRGVTGDTTLTASDYYLQVDTTSGHKTILLPSAADFPGREFVIANHPGTNNVVLTPTLSQLINGIATYVIGSTYKSAVIISHGLGWQVTASHT